jgi:hypothetical protein
MRAANFRTDPSATFAASGASISAPARRPWPAVAPPGHEVPSKIRLALALTVCLAPALASAETAPVREGGGDGRTGGMGVGTRATHSIPRPGTDMETAGSGAGNDRPDAGVKTGNGGLSAPDRRP